MESSSLKGVVNKGFLRRIQVASSTGRDEARSSNPNNASVNVGLSLQSGQVAFSLAIQRLNHVGEFLNVSTDTMEKLLKLTDRAIDLAEEAASTGSSEGRRVALNRDFKQVAQEFRKTVRGATLDGTNVLTKEELASELEKAGLDRKASIGVADLYGKLLENPEDDLFASELTRGKRPVSIPASAYIGPLVSAGGGGPAGETTYTYGTTQVSNNSTTSTYAAGAPTKISDNVVGATGSYAASAISNSTSPQVTNSGFVTDTGHVLTTSGGAFPELHYNDGNTSGTGILNSTWQILAVDEASGNFIFKSNEDLLSYNPDGVDQLYLASATGSVRQQYTTFTSSDSITFGEVSISADPNPTVVFSYQTGTGGTDLFIDMVTANVIGEDPATSNRTNIESQDSATLGNIDAAFGSLEINNAGSYVTYTRFESSFNPSTQYSVQFKDTATLTANALLASTEFAIKDTVGFATNDSVFVLAQNGVVRDLYAVGYADGSFGSAILTGTDVIGFVTGEQRSGSGAGFFATIDAVGQDIRLYDSSGTELWTYDAADANVVVQMNIAAIDSSNKPRLGVFGYADLTGLPSDDELYVVEYGGGTQTRTGKTGVITSVSDIYESDYSDPAEDHLFVHAVGGSTTDVAAGTTPFSVKGVNSATGYSVIESTEDLLGFNGSNYRQLFLVDDTGAVTQQLTDASSMLEYGEVAMSDSNMTVIYEVYDSGAGESQLIKATLPGLGAAVDPATITNFGLQNDTGSTGIGAFTNIGISSDGSYAAAIAASGGSLYDLGTNSRDGFLKDDLTVKGIGFVETNTVAVLRDSDTDGSNDTLETFVAGDVAYGSTLSGRDIELFTTLEKRSGSTGFVAFTEFGANANDVVLVDQSFTGIGSVDLDSTNDSVTRISLAYDPVSGTADIGIYGTIASLDPEAQLYRVEGSLGSPVGNVGQSGLIASAYNVYSSFDTTVPQTTSYVNTVGGGTVSGPVDPAAFSVLAVHEATGSYIIASTQDFLGQNASGGNQLFLVDETGTVIHQYTGYVMPGTEFQAVDFSDTRETIVFSEKTSGSASVFKVEVGVLGEFAGSSTTTNIASGRAGDINRVKINADGSHIAFSEALTGQIYIDSDGSDDAWLTADTANVDFGFTDLNTLAIARNVDGDASADQVVEYELFSGVYSASLASGVDIGAFTTAEKGSHANGFVGYSTLTGGRSQDVFVRYSGTGTVAGSFDGSGMDDISRLSLAFNGAEEIEVGMFGVVSSIGGDSDAELYRLGVTASAPGGGGGGGSVYSTLPAIDNDARKIFSRTLLTRPEAYRVLNDLKALRAQIQTNLDTLESTTSYVAENVKLARVTGTAFIEAADSSSATSSPEAAVLRIRELLQQNGSGVLDQLENLDRVAVNALVRD